MKKNMIKKLTLWCVITVMLFAVVSFFGCNYGDGFISDYEWSEGSFSLEVTADRSDVRLGEEVTITATFRNLSGKNLNLYVYPLGPEISRIPGKQNARNAEFESSNIIFFYSEVRPSFNDFIGTNRDFKMPYYYGYRLAKDAIITRTETFTFIDNFNPIYCSCDFEELIRCPQCTEIYYAFESRRFQKKYNYIFFSISIFTSRNANAYTRVILYDYIQFNIITEGENLYE